MQGPYKNWLRSVYYSHRIPGKQAMYVILQRTLLWFHHWPVDSSQEGPLMWKMIPCHDVIMNFRRLPPKRWPLGTENTNIFVYQFKFISRSIYIYIYIYTVVNKSKWGLSWWRHQMETFSALLAICAGNSPVPGEFPTQRPVTRSFDVNFDLRPDKRLSKQPLRWWFETLSHSLWRHRNVMTAVCTYISTYCTWTYEQLALSRTHMCTTAWIV